MIANPTYLVTFNINMFRNIWNTYVTKNEKSNTNLYKAKLEILLVKEQDDVQGGSVDTSWFIYAVLLEICFNNSLICLSDIRAVFLIDEIYSC